MYKLIASDLDETLINSNHEISTKDLEAIKAYQKAGGIFVCATGRPFWSAEGTLKDIGQYKTPNTYMISYNGGIITENSENRILHFEGLSYETANALFLASKKYDVCFHVYTNEVTYVYNNNDDERAYLNNRMEVTDFDAEDLTFIKDKPIIKCLFENTDREYLQNIAKDIADITKDLDVSYSSNRYIEFNKQGVNKGEGLRILAEMLNIDIKDTIAVGDNYNDLSMIKAAGLGIGVANTVESMKPECDLITKNTVDESAIAEVIYEYAMKD